MVQNAGAGPKPKEASGELDAEMSSGARKGRHRQGWARAREAHVVISAIGIFRQLIGRVTASRCGSKRVDFLTYGYGA